MGYFAARVAPVGGVGPSAVAALFFNFHPAMVRRSVPDRVDLRRPGHGAGGPTGRARPVPSAAWIRRWRTRARHLVPLLEPVIERADGSGRVLFSANRALGPPDDPVEALWQACTCLREHRGDGHVAALTAAGLDGCQALVLFALSEGLPASMFQASRGWSGTSGSWPGPASRPGAWWAPKGSPRPGSSSGRAIEQTTDDLAAPPFLSLPAREAEEVLASVRSVAGAVAEGGDIPFPNPMGLPAPGPA